MEIVSAIIAVTQQPSSYTRMMGSANLSYSLLKEYLRFMVGRHLIDKRDIAKGAKKKTSVYQATQKGNRFLELYCESLILLHGERFLENNVNLAEAYLLQYCRKNKLTLGLKGHKSLDTKIRKASEV
ncbi:MAG TPA: winged helix-turn-helix domain-containing protein [Candidatus Bathyarchaeia archaeon]